MALQSSGERTQRRADQALLIAYHEAQLANLIEHVREGLKEYEAGRIDAFELDGIIHHYMLAARELWKFCSVPGSGVRTTVRTLEWLRDRGEEPDWWKSAVRSKK